MTTFTHLGERASVGYRHADHHRSIKAGRVHACTQHGQNNFRTCCGLELDRYSSDHRTDEAEQVRIAGPEDKPTCKACLKTKPVWSERPKVQVRRLMREKDGEAKCYVSNRKGSQPGWLESLQEKFQQSGEFDRVWIEEAEEYKF